jgi:acyl-CoA hydrolase
MHFAVEVRARDPRGGPDADRLCTHCVIVFVALDAPEGTPVPVPAWTPVTDEDRQLATYAREVMALGRGLEPMLDAVGPAVP